MLNSVTVLLSPLRAKELRDMAGCSTREEIEEYLCSQITMPVGDLKARSFARKLAADPAAKDLPDDALVPVFLREQMHVIVVGDPKGSNVVQGWSQGNAHSASIDKWR